MFVRVVGFCYCLVDVFECFGDHSHFVGYEYVDAGDDVFPIEQQGGVECAREGVEPYGYVGKFFYEVVVAIVV